MTTDPTAAALLAPSPSDIPTGGRVVSGIRAAAESTGVDFDFLLAQATQESGLDPEARNRHSSAAGLFQFTAPTWLQMIKQHGADHGLAEQAAAISKGTDGKLEVKDKAARKAILDLRKDPRLSAVMAAEYAKGNARVLEHRLGRPATNGDLYLAHFLGAGGAARVLENIKDDPKRSAHGLLPEAARANPDLFHESGSDRPRTVAGLYKAVQARFRGAFGGNGITETAAVHTAAVTGTAAASAYGRHHHAALAALRPSPRPEADDTAVSLAMDMASLRPSVRPDSPATDSPDSMNQQIAQDLAPAAAAPVTASAVSPAPFATAIEPESPFFPAAIPPAPIANVGPSGGGGERIIFDQKV
jgi:hypothetical protein